MQFMKTRALTYNSHPKTLKYTMTCFDTPFIRATKKVKKKKKKGYKKKLSVGPKPTKVDPNLCANKP